MVRFVEFGVIDGSIYFQSNQFFIFCFDKSKIQANIACAPEMQEPPTGVSVQKRVSKPAAVFYIYMKIKTGKLIGSCLDHI